jgi:MFS family permease
MTPTPEDLLWARRADQLRLNQLTVVRETAEKWRNGLMALTGLFSAAALVVGPELGAAKAAVWRITISVLLVLGLAALIWGSWLAMQASFGVLTRTELTGENLRQWETDEAAAATGKLQSARRLFLGGLVFVVAVAVVAVMTAQQSESSRLLVTNSSGAYCGTLEQGTPSAITIKTSVGVQAIPLSTIKSTITVDKC